MRLYSKEWVVYTLEKLGGEASVDLLRLMSAGLAPAEAYVADCYAPEVTEEGLLSCIEGAVKELAEDGVVRLEGGKVKLVKAPHLKGALRGEQRVL
ncbi:hypothetical protein [Ignicoccus hospitalis]|uniref:hypothetical protein n=1 Tax=Ignicoccus hospitalis TaxID=160233 RepID=UPI00069765F4|nr:hypothetical protein [Ignicoccus hospitalis]HIH90220.1 hypothetical protein [Desulfurococcaceae archaeon]